MTGAGLSFRRLVRRQVLRLALRGRVRWVHALPLLGRLESGRL